MLLVQNIIRNATIYKDKTATEMDGRVNTWSEFTDRVSRAAAALQELGVKEGDRVGIMSLNSDRYLEAQFAIYWMGAIIVPMNWRWSLDENVYTAKDAGLAALIADDAFSVVAIGVRDAMAESDSRIPLLHFCDGDPADGFESWDALIDSSKPAPVANVDYGSVAGIFYTGGTTGFPKGAVLSHTALWSSGVTGVSDLSMPSDTIFLHAAPMFHLADMAFSNCTTIAGGSHCFVSTFTPATTLDAIDKYQASFSLLVPTMIGMLLEAPEFKNADISNLKHLVYGASPMPEPILLKALELMPDVEFIQGYGQTEMGPIVSLLPHKYHATEGPNSKLRSAGRPIGCVQVRITDEDGNELPQGESGEIRVRGPNALDRYWNKPEQTAETIIDGWVRTGDIAYMDEDGFLYICDRAKDMIITGGENVFSAEVENAALSHPKVGEVAVVGAPDDKFGERVHAIVVPAAEAEAITQQELYEHCQSLIASYKCPRSLDIRNEALPLSGAGKVLKKDLRAPYWEGHKKGVA